MCTVAEDWPALAVAELDAGALGTAEACNAAAFAARRYSQGGTAGAAHSSRTGALRCGFEGRQFWALEVGSVGPGHAVLNHEPGSIPSVARHDTDSAAVLVDSSRLNLGAVVEAQGRELSLCGLAKRLA